jgi:hypothetical protein
MGLEWGPGAERAGGGGDCEGKDEADKLYQKPTDFMPMDGQSPQSRQLIEN